MTTTKKKLSNQQKKAINTLNIYLQKQRRMSIKMELEIQFQKHFPIFFLQHGLVNVPPY